ncbi:hypothetical protein [Microbacterium maritypicum]
MRWIGKRTLKGGYLDTARLRIAYRGFTIRPFIRSRPIAIGNARNYCLGPISIIVKSPAERHTSQRSRA